MSSLRKKVSSYFRQLSFHNEPRVKQRFINENTFINKYLTGQIVLKDAPPVLHGRTPNDLPNFEIGEYATGAQSIVGSATGPNGGLTTVKRTEKHLSIPDADIDYIDKPDEVVAEQTARKRDEQTPMKIKVAGQTYLVPSCLEKNRKSLSLGSLTDEKPVETCSNTNTNKNVNNNNIKEGETTCCDVNSVNNDVTANTNCEEDVNGAQNYALSKSKSAGYSLDNKTRKKGKIIRLTQRPGQQGAYQNSCNLGHQKNPPEKWEKKTDFVYGISDSLYDVNQVTKEKNGNPIADCYGIIARGDSAILALADGVNWGEKASIAAKSAVHGSLHYINKTVFDDTSLFNFEIDSLNENAPINTIFEKTVASHCPQNNQITNTNDIFICLLRAFNSAHNLILENNGMLTTLTVAIVLPLKQGNYKKGRAEKYICCACNLGDTFAYVYSPKCGIREITKGSHDITSNRDMRDALGALGPVDGINPELNNLTLSATTLEPGDIVLVASDGLTDNYDPSVCKFTVNQTVYDAPKHKATNINPQTNHKVGARPPIPKPNTNRASLIQAQSQPHVSGNRLGASNISRLASTNINSAPAKPKHTNVKTKEVKIPDPQDTVDYSNPLVAQFIQDNAPDHGTTRTDPNKENTTKTPHHLSTSHVITPKKPTNLSKSSSTSHVLKTKTNTNQQAPRMAFLRSKTSLDLSAAQRQTAQIKRNEEGLAFVTPQQKYELTLLLMEDILRRGLSGQDTPCATARTLCENLVRYTVSVTAAKRRSLEDADLYYDLKDGVQVELGAREKKLRRKRCLEKIQNLPGKLDHVTVVAYNVGNRGCAGV